MKAQSNHCLWYYSQ